MATQEPNVYAGLAVVIGGLMHARPQFFAKVMGELLFWVGEDKMLFGSRLRHLGAEVADRGPRRLGDARRAPSSRTTRGSTTNGKRKILGLNAAKLYGVEVPQEFQLPGEDGEPAAPRRRAAGRGRRVSLKSRRPRRAGHGLRPGARRADHHARLRRLLRRVRRTGTSTCASGCRRRSARRTSRTSWQPTRAPPCAGCRRCARSRSCSRTTTRARRSTPPSARGDGVRRRRSPARPRATSTRCASCSGARRCVARQARVCQALLDGGATPRDGRRAARRGPARRAPDAVRCRRAARARSACRTAPTRPRSIAGDGARLTAADLPTWLRRARLVSLSLEANGGMCRDAAARALRQHRTRRRSQHESGAPARVPRAPEARRGRRAEDHRPARRHREDRRGRPVPHRPAHPGGPVGREVRGQAALHARPRERRLDPRGRRRA